MKLLNKKVYKVYSYTTGTPLPTLEVQGNPKVYVSLSDKTPKLEDMTDVTADLVPGFNMLNGHIRWIAAVCDYTDDEEDSKSDAVYECGIVTNPKLGGR